MSTGALTGPEFLALFQEFERSALRLESRGHTHIDDEQPELRAFLAGTLPEAYQWEQDVWTDMVTRQTSAGKLFRRARVMDRPLTDYNRYMLYTTPYNLVAGEDIRYLERDRANALDLPDHDFWVFDSRLLCTLRFTADGRPVGYDVVTEPAVVARHEQWALRAFGHAISYRAFLAEDPTRVQPPVRLGATKAG